MRESRRTLPPPARVLPRIIRISISSRKKWLVELFPLRDDLFKVQKKDSDAKLGAASLSFSLSLRETPNDTDERGGRSFSGYDRVTKYPSPFALVTSYERSKVRASLESNRADRP